MPIPARAATSMKLFRERKSAHTKILRISPPTLKTKSLIVGTPSAHVSVVLGHYAWGERKKDNNEKNDKMAFGISSVRPSLPGKCPGGYGRPVGDVVYGGFDLPCGHGRPRRQHTKRPSGARRGDDKSVA